MEITIHPDDIETGTTDARGRIYLGPEYQNKTVEVAILHVADDTDRVEPERRELSENNE